MKIRLVDRGVFSRTHYRYVVQKRKWFFWEDIYVTDILPDALEHYNEYPLPRVLSERFL